MTKNVIYREYGPGDAVKIGSFNKELESAYLFNNDFKPENIFLATDKKNQVLAIGHLEPYSFLEKNGETKTYVSHFRINIVQNPMYSIDESVKDGILTKLIKRAKEIKKCHHKTIKLYVSLPNQKTNDIDYFLSKGFCHNETAFIMRRDLTKPIDTDFPRYNGVDVSHWKVETEKEQLKYLQAQKDSEIPELWSKEKLVWFKSRPNWHTFTAFYQGNIIGSVMTWELGENISMTEQMFILPHWRQKGIARQILTDALVSLRDKGKTEVLLGVLSHNKGAINLCKSAGYHLIETYLQFSLTI
ncbi:GNAT family N-acetyltransferase [Scopulibacillus cellulosilyticus]|uniref:GNAT family N-acetyltransferase n=1 Tax=Scopulibacillus cellulosilyticus TaxID=2665665 RepID=A0ABW2PY69_9BACL